MHDRIDPAVREHLHRMLSNARLTNSARNLFMDWPALEETTLRFLQYVSPWLVVDGENLAEATVRKAVEAYEATAPKGKGYGHRRFLESLAAAAKVLCELRVSVRNRDEQWAVWTYDEPLMTYLARHNRASIQIRKRDVPVSLAPVLIKLLASISTARDLEFADLDIPTLLLDRTAA